MTDVLALRSFANEVGLALIIVTMRHAGMPHTGDYHSVAPSFGALLAVALGNGIEWPLALAALAAR